MKVELNPITRAINVLPQIPNSILHWDEMNCLIDDLRKIENHFVTPLEMFCPYPWCKYKCSPPKEMKVVEDSICPVHLCTLHVKSWYQFAKDTEHELKKAKQDIQTRDRIVEYLKEECQRLHKKLTASIWKKILSWVTSLLSRK